MEDGTLQDGERRGGENWSTGICQWNYTLDADWLEWQFRGKVVNNVEYFMHNVLVCKE